MTNSIGHNGVGKIQYRHKALFKEKCPNNNWLDHQEVCSRHLCGVRVKNTKPWRSSDFSSSHIFIQYVCL